MGHDTDRVIAPMDGREARVSIINAGRDARRKLEATMANVVPKSRQEMIQWFSQRAANWAASAQTLGLTIAEVTELATLINAAQTAQSAAFSARISAKDSTITYHTAADALAAYGAALILRIKGNAAATNNPNIYAEASIPLPEDPSPLGPPATPTDLSAAINNEGQVEVRWNASREGGTSFIIERSITPVGQVQGPWTLLTSVEERRFIDQNVPLGLSSALYRVRAQRVGGMSIASEPGQVLFGTPTQQQQSEGGLTLAA